MSQVQASCCKFSVDCEWPSTPAEWHMCVSGVSAEEARHSAIGLRRIYHAFRLRVSVPGANAGDPPVDCVVAEWDRLGNLWVLDGVGLGDRVPPWARGEEPLEGVADDRRVA